MARRRLTAHELLEQLKSSSYYEQIRFISGLEADAELTYLLHQTQLVKNYHNLAKELLDVTNKIDRELDRRTPHQRKQGRNQEIHRLLTHEGITSWVTIREQLQRINPEWVTIKATRRLVSLKALKNGYVEWHVKTYGRPPEQ
jgi:hypothetical protein